MGFSKSPSFVHWSQCPAANPLDIDFRSLVSEDSVNLAEESAGIETLVVNTPSRCGQTPQFSEFDKLDEEFYESGFAVLGFSSKHLAVQDPGPEIQIANVCYLKCDVVFPVVEKTHVRAEKANLLTGISFATQV